MENKKIDRRVLSTKKALKSALLKLIENKNINDITVTQLCNEAGINRNTFYAHYKDQYSLLESVSDELFETIADAVDELLSLNRTHMALTRICSQLKGNTAFSSLVIMGRDNSVTINKIVEYARERTYDSWKALGFKGTREDFLIIYSCMSIGCIAAIRQWLEYGGEKTPEQTARFLENTVIHGIGMYFTNPKDFAAKTLK